MDAKSFALGYNACASQKGGSVSQAELEAAIKKVVPEWALEETPPKDAVTSVNGKVGAVNLPIPSEAADVKADPAGAAESMTNALREEVNTILGDYAKSTAIVDKIYWHNVSYVSHEDIRVNVRTLRTMIETVIGTDTGKSMRAVAALVVAEIVGDASDSFDTLEEIAAWIEAHPNDVAAMVKRITDLETAMGGKVSKTDIINTLDSTALDKPLSAAMGAKLNAMLTEISDELDGKTTPEQVAKAISDALTGYALKDHNHDGTYAKPADIPTKISQLAGDSTHRTVTDAEKTGWNGKADGSHNHDGVYAKPSDIPTVPQTLPNPYALTILGKTYTGGKAVSLTVEEIMEAIKTASGGVVAYLDGNRLVLSGNLPDATYTAYYEIDGELVEIGDLTLGSITPDPVTYTIKWVNYDGTVLETDTVTEGETPAYNGATPTKPADSQYTYTFKGWDKTVVAAVADATYTAVYDQTAKPVEPDPDPIKPKNFATPSAWVQKGRIRSNGAVATDASETTYATDFVDCQNGDVIYINNAQTNHNLFHGAYNSSEGVLGAADYNGTNNYFVFSDTTDTSATVTIKSSSVAYMRFTLGNITDTSKVVINIKRNGEWRTK